MEDSATNIFPENITVEECRAAIRNAPGFREAVKEDYLLFNYDYAFTGSFPDPMLAATPLERRLLQIRRYVHAGSSPPATVLHLFFLFVFCRTSVLVKPSLGRYPVFFCLFT